MNEDDLVYLLARAEEEIQRAQQSADPSAVSSHFRLAELYLDAVYGTDVEAASSSGEAFAN